MSQSALKESLLYIVSFFKRKQVCLFRGTKKSWPVGNPSKGCQEEWCQKESTCFFPSINKPCRDRCPRTCKTCPDENLAIGLENGGKSCLKNCSKEGKCDWCGSDGWCCQKGLTGNGCDGSIGGSNRLECVLKGNTWTVKIGEVSGPWGPLPEIGVHYLNLQISDQFSQLNSTK